MIKFIFILALPLVVSCYSFTGGSIPNHLKSLYIVPVEDNSGFGNPLYREDLNQTIVDVFNSDNSFILSEGGGDAELTIKILSINESAINLQAGQIESERKVVLTCSVLYYDEIKQKEIFRKNFSNEQTYDVKNTQVNRDEALLKAIEQISDDILLAVVSGW